jgi:hypothetical protein
MQIDEQEAIVEFAACAGPVYPPNELQPVSREDKRWGQPQSHRHATRRTDFTDRNCSETAGQPDGATRMSGENW